MKVVPKPTYDPRWEGAILVLAAGGTRAEAADVAGVPYHQIDAWYQNDVFRRELDERHRSLIAAYRAETGELFRKSIATLLRLMDSEDEYTALRSALAVWERVNEQERPSPHQLLSIAAHHRLSPLLLPPAVVVDAGETLKRLRGENE